MLIDWFTVFAQVVNFLILVWLLKRYLYRPVLDAIDAREKLIAAELADAAEQKQTAKIERETFEAKQAAHNNQAATLLRQAQEVADKERARLLLELQKTAETMRIKQQEKMAGDARKFNQMLSQKVSQEVFAIARKTLGDLATMTLEDRIIEVFLRRLNDLDPDTHATLAGALKASSASFPPLLRSAFDLSAAQQQTLSTAINDLFSVDSTLQFKTAANLISGVELSVNGQKLAWSIADYLNVLEEDVDALFDKKLLSAQSTL